MAEFTFLWDTRNYIFIAFLAFYVIFSIGIYIQAKKSRISNTIIIFLANLMGLISFGWLLSELYDLTFIFFFFLGLVISIIVAGFLWGLTGYTAVPWGNQVVLAFWEFEENQNNLFRKLRLLSILFITSYAIISAALILYYQFYLFKGNLDIGQQLAQNLVIMQRLGYILVFILVSSLLITFPSIIGVLLSKNMSYDTRNLIAISQFCYLSINSLLLSLIIWILNFAGIKISLEIKNFIHIGSESFNINTQIIILLTIFFLGAFLIPYLSGWQRAKKWRLLLLEKQRKWLDEILDILDFPDSLQYNQKLYILKDKIYSSKKVFADTQFINIYSCNIIENELNPLETQCQIQPIQADPRICYLDFMEKFSIKISEIINKYEIEKNNKSEVKKIFKDYSDMFQNRKEELEKLLERESNIKPQLWIILTLIFSPIAAAILNTIAEKLATSMSFFALK